MTEHPTTRRAILAGAASLPIAAAAIALPAAASAEPLIESLAAKLHEADARQREALRLYDVAEDAMAEWEKRNPMPILREFKSVAWNGPERGAYLKQVIEADDPSEVTLIDPCADEKAAVAEYEAALRLRGRRKAAAEAQCGYQKAEAAENAASEAVEQAISDLADTEAHTVRGLVLKARGAAITSDITLAWSVIADLRDMEVDHARA